MERFEDRSLLSGVVPGPNVNTSLLLGNQDESAIAVNPLNTQQLFVSANNAAGGLFAARSIDGGATWLPSNGSDFVIADGGDSLVPACCDPTVTWDSFGNLFLSYINSSIDGIPIALSTDGGATFTAVTSLGNSVDQPTIVTGPGTGGVSGSVWVTYAEGGTIVATGAPVTGLGLVGSFSAAVPLAGIGQFGDITVGPNGQVVVNGQSDTEIQVITDPDGLGAAPFGGVVIATAMNVARFDEIPAQRLRTIDSESGLAYDRSGGAHNGRLYLVYTEETVDESNNTDILLRSSDDNGATWSDPVRVNDDTRLNSQFFPKIAVDQTSGVVGIVWLDARNSVTNTTVQLFASVSDNGGLTWSRNQLVSPGQTDGTVSATGGQQLGDYLGLAFHNGVLHPSWADNSNSTLNNPNGSLAELEIYSAAVPTGAVLFGPWESQGPAPGIDGQEDVPPDNQINGAVQAIAVHPTDPNILYVAGVNGGVWRTDNATSAAPHWVPLTDGFPSLSIGALEFDPTDPTGNTLIASTGATSSYFLGDQFTGVLRTTDGGQTWSELGTTDLAGQNLISATARGSILLAASDNVWGGGAGDGLFRSTNGGANWTLISGSNGLPSGQVSDVVGDPLSPTTLYAAVRGANGGVFVSTDTGLNWSNITSGIGIVGDTTTKIELAVHHVGADTAVFAAVVNEGSLAGVFRSLNGAAFTALDVPSGGGQGEVHLAISAEPSNPNIVYLGGAAGEQYLSRVDASLPSGQQITAIAGGTFHSPHVDTREMQIDANGNLILGTDGGLFRLPTPTLNTGSWSAIVGDISLFEIHSIAYDSVTNVVMAGTQDNGTLFQVSAGNSTWAHPGFGDGGDVVIDDTSLASVGQSIRYYSSQFNFGWTREVYDSNNNRVSSTSLAEISDGSFTTPVELNIVDPTRLIVGGVEHLYESRDQGASLTAIGPGVNGIGSFEGVGGGQMVYGGFQAGVPNPDLIYAASGRNVLRQTISGGGFTSTSPGGGTIRGVTANPNSSSSVFAIDVNHVFLSTNSGTDWMDVTANLTSISAADFHAVEFLSGTLANVLVVGTSSGVFTADVAALGTGTPWSRLGNNLPDAIVYDLEFDATDNVLVAGTMGRGAWTVSNVTFQLGIGAAIPPTQTVRLSFGLDFGDAPAPYATLLADDGARHAAIGPTLGDARDFELDGQPNADATGDDNATTLSLYAVSSTTFDFEDISTTGTQVLLDDDTFSSLIAIPFNFDFFGSAETGLFICSNGFLSFSGIFPSFIPTSIPNANVPNDLIAGWWTDLNPSEGGTITYQTLGAPGSRSFVVQFTNIPHLFNEIPVTFQFKLFEGSNNIEVHYLSVPSNGNTHVAGVENAAGNLGVQFFNGTGSLPSNSAVLYTPVPVGDEDGVTFVSSLLASTSTATTASIAIDLENAGLGIVSTNNFLDAWLDFNHDGDWDDPDEQILASYNLGRNDGRQVVQFTIPRDTGSNVETGTTFARFRVSTTGGLLSTGFASDGEVEDYQVTITQTGGVTNAIDLLPGNTIVDLFNGNVRVREASTGTVISSVPIAEISNLVFNGTANADDTLTLNFSTGNFLPSGGLTFNGGAGGNDKLAVIGDNRNDSLNYTPGSLTGSGTLLFNDGTSNRTISFTGLEPVDITGMASVTVSGSSGVDNYTLSNGVDATMGGVNAAVIVSGTRSGTTIESAHIWNIGSLTIDTGAGNDKLALDYSNGNPSPVQAVNFNGGAGGNDKLVVIGDSVNDSVNYSPGSVTGSGTLAYNDGNNSVTWLIAFTGLEPIDITGVPSVTVSGSSGADNYTLSNGFDTTMGGLIPATVVSGQRSGVTIESAHIWNVARITIDAGAGNDVVNASGISRAVVLIGGAGNDTLTGGAGNDTLTGGAGRDSLNGGTGTDTVAETTADDVMTLTDNQLTGNGTDKLTSIERAVLTGTLGNNTLNASAFTLGNVTLLGGNGNDTLVGSAFTGAVDADGFNDSLDGGEGIDRAVQFSRGNQTLVLGSTPGTNVVTGASSSAGDFWKSIEELHFIGNGNAATTLDASLFNGSVTLDGGAGSDLLIGGTRNNVLNGNDGNDVLIGNETADTLTGGAGNDRLDGRNGADVLKGQAGNDTLRGGNGDDRMFGDDGRDILFGGSGNDLLNGGAGSDVLTGESGDDTINGGAGNDAISGGNGNDHLNGGLGNDTILGGNGDDVLRSEGGSDYLSGDAGSDRFVGSGARIILGGGDDTISGSGNKIDAIFIFDFEKLLV